MYAQEITSKENKGHTWLIYRLETQIPMWSIFVTQGILPRTSLFLSYQVPDSTCEHWGDGKFGIHSFPTERMLFVINFSVAGSFPTGK